MEGIFRVSGKMPELWYPDTGRIEEAPVWREVDGRTIVPLHFDPAGSVFVVFRKPAAADHIVSAQYTTTLPPVKPAHGEFTILKAEYGVFSMPVSGCTDVTVEVQDLIARGQRRILAGNQLAGDPAPSTPKELRIEYVGRSKQIVTITEGRTVELPPGARIIRAFYGVMSGEPPAPDNTVDITTKVVAVVRGGELLVKAGNELAGGDPVPLRRKELIVKYRHQGSVKTVRVAENRMLALPEGQSADAQPDYELSVDATAKTLIYAWQPGKIVGRTAAGREWQAEVPDVPKPVEVTGPWNLYFPPNGGAPAVVSLPRLISWTEHADNGVKYFSGTATYSTEMDLPEALFGQGNSLRLSLGVVKNLAEVFVNGKSLGVLWKPPFRTDVTTALRPGRNTIEIRITNLWPNRLIGDELLPDDREWEGTRLKAWPQWLLEGKPSPTGRVTFTTWHHWSKDDTLLPSGLLGPVTITSGVTVALQ
jgi:hypothetical protein